MKLKQYIPAACYLLALVLSFFSKDYFIEIVVALTVVSLLFILDKLGRGIILIETIAFLYIFTCLFMPLVGYEVYNYDNLMARLWKNYMRVPREVYYSYSLPAISAFCFAIALPLSSKSGVDEGLNVKEIIKKSSKLLQTDKRIGILLMVVGLFSFASARFLPLSLQYVSSILFFCSFAGILYIYFTPDFKRKSLIISLFFIFLVFNAISIGMFTVVAYMSVTIFSFFFIGRKISLLKKVFVMLSAFFILIILQNTKRTYRSYIWRKAYTGDRTVLFTQLFIDNIQKGEALFEKRAFFPVYSRTNQGFMVSLVMQRIPSVKPFDNGEALRLSMLSSLIPRFLWPDKPIAGGKFNMEYYAGWKLRGYSTNVGPLGEAYGSFGISGGILFMFLLGHFIRWVYKKIFLIAKRIPVIIFWIPVLFYQVTYSAENDTLQILNSIIKTAIFIVILYKLFPALFMIKNELLPAKKRQPKPNFNIQ